MTVFERLGRIIANTGYFLDEHNGAVTALATIFIAVFTIVLALVTRRQARLTRIAANPAARSAAVAERSLTDLEAPFVYVEITRAGIVHHGPQETTYGDLKFRFVNHGRTPAHIVELAETVEAINIDQLPPILGPTNIEANVMPWGVISPPHGGFTVEFTHSFLDPETLHVLKVEEESIFFLGWFVYTTIFDTEHISGFCFKFNPANNSFVREGGSDYNYLRKKAD